MRKLISKLFVVICLSALSLTANAQFGPQDAGKVPAGATQLSIQDSILGNAGDFFRQPLLVCAGNKDGSNAMTIGWIGVGVTWFNPAITVYLAEKRFTRTYMEKCDYFTVMSFKDGNVMRYMGSHSGKDGDKAKALDLHVKFTDNGAPYYAEADKVVECRVMYGAQYKAENIRDPFISNFYKNFRDGIHYEYIGRITKAWKN